MIGGAAGAVVPPNGGGDGDGVGAGVGIGFCFPVLVNWTLKLLNPSLNVTVHVSPGVFENWPVKVHTRPPVEKKMAAGDGSGALLNATTPVHGLLPVARLAE